jgi:hypothetical protein
MAVYKRYRHGRTTYQKIVELPNRQFQIRDHVSAENPNGSATPGRYDTFREAERALYIIKPGTQRIA